MVVKLLIATCMVLLLVGSVSAYYCIQEDDNDSVKNFKSNLNYLALKNDIQEYNLTEEGFNLKLKYFYKCD